MRIALIDNMNNNFFAFARYLRDLGIESYLYEIPNSKMEHFRAQADTFEDVSKINWIKKFPVDVNNKSWFFFQKKKIYREFNNYDLIISCGLSSAYLKRAGINSDIIMPYGSDLYDLPFKNINFTFNLIRVVKDLFAYHKAYYQRKALYESKLLVTGTHREIIKKSLQKLNLRGYNTGIPMLYNKEKLNTKENGLLWQELEGKDFIVFNHSRQYWKSNVDNLDDFSKYGGLKRNDKVIKAFAEFIKNTKYKFPVLVLFEYGPDVENSKKLIKELNIEKYVIWKPRMNRKNILYGLSKADVVTNAFRENMLEIGGVCYEGLAMGKIVVTNCREVCEDINNRFYKAPMIHAVSEKDILDIFKDYEQNNFKYKNISFEAKKWFDENLGVGLAKKYAVLFDYLVKNKFQNNDEISKIIDKIFKKTINDKV